MSVKRLQSILENISWDEFKGRHGLRKPVEKDFRRGAHRNLGLKRLQKSLGLKDPVQGPRFGKPVDPDVARLRKKLGFKEPRNRDATSGLLSSKIEALILGILGEIPEGATRTYLFNRSVLEYPNESKWGRSKDFKEALSKAWDRLISKKLIKEAKVNDHGAPIYRLTKAQASRNKLPPWPEKF